MKTRRIFTLENCKECPSCDKNRATGYWWCEKEQKYFEQIEEGFPDICKLDKAPGDIETGNCETCRFSKANSGSWCQHREAKMTYDPKRGYVNCNKYEPLPKQGDNPELSHKKPGKHKEAIR